MKIIVLRLVVFIIKIGYYVFYLRKRKKENLNISFLNIFFNYFKNCLF